MRDSWLGALAGRFARARERCRASSLAPLALAGAMLLLTTQAVVVAQSAGEQDGSSSTAKRLTVERDDTTIEVTQQADNVSGARFLLRNPNCAEDDFTSIFYAPPPGENRTVVAGDTTLYSRLVIVREPRDGESAGNQSLELLDADVTFNRPGCIETMEPVESPRVELRQGRTTIVGSRFTLDQDTDLGTMEGPVDLERAAEGDSPALSATADALELDVDTEITTLVGNVEIRSEDRVSEAARLELRESEGIAILSGDPARTRVGEDVIEGETLRYYLDTNDVVVIGNVKGSFDLPE